ncbi:MAG TPA: Ig-like domain-containing protein [Gemmatimonadaceae bacterium]
MRRWLIGRPAVVLGLVACASASPPPGGPVDITPPKLVRMTPDSNATNVATRYASFYFDETINDRGSGAQDVGNYFLVSPSDGESRVFWHRSRIDVRPRNGFRANTAYTVTLLPGLSDLRGNQMRSGASVVFSTGPTIPKDRINGTAIDWVAGRPAARALIQGVTPDSVTYLAQSDSVGHFTLGPLPPGTYLVRAIVDQNNNHALDRNEPFDSVTVVVPQRASDSLVLRMAPRDTLPPRIVNVAPADSGTLRVTFDRLVDSRQPFTPDMFRLVAADSSVVPVTAVLTPEQEARVARERDRVRADSARRADSLAGKVLPPPRPTPPPAANARTDSVPSPFTALALKIGRPLAPASVYRLSVTGVRGLTNRTQPSERSFTTPRPPPPRPATDTTRTPRGAPARPAPTRPAPARPPS